MKIILKVLLIIGLFVAHAQALPLAKEDVPHSLKPWVNWVLYNQNEQTCSHAYNSDQSFCAWPSALKLDLNNTQGQFSQQWSIQRQGDYWVRLPGNKQQWPHNVKVNNVEKIVVERNGYPSIQLNQGEHEVSGSFQWDNLPESLTIPSATGLVDIRRNGETIDFPRINQQGQLWLDKSTQQKDVQDALDVKVFRKVIDGHPMQIETRFILNISGRSRDVVFPSVLLNEFIALSLESPLPSRINQQGDLQIQVRPGNWVVTLVSYAPAIMDELVAPSFKSLEANQQVNLPKQEVWVFQANPTLRLTEISGVASIDSRQTRLPKDWQQYPAYLIEPNNTFKLKTLQRGSASPEPNRLTLNRTLWMDFDGKGFTIDDNIYGTMTRGWRLVASPAIDLGSVRIDNEPQFITTLSVAGSKQGKSNDSKENSESKGVEVRRGQINLQAASRYTDSVSTLPVTGWQHDFQRVTTRLFIAPGWKLFSAYGADNLPNTWLQRWTLLDLFVVLVIAVAVGRLWDWKWGVFALLTVVLIWHEPNAPKFIWLNLVAAIALLRVLPDGWAKKLVWWYRNAVFLALVLIVLPFIIAEVRHGLYPQLGKYADYNQPVYPLRMNDKAMTTAYASDEVVQGSMNMHSPVSKPSSKSYRIEKKIRSTLSQSVKQMPKASKVNQMVDPHATIQTGPGLPRWHWQEVSFVWNSPVNEIQTLRLTLISPRMNLVLNFLRVILLLLLIGRLIRVFNDDIKTDSSNDNNKDGKGGKFNGRFPWFSKVAAIMLLPVLLLLTYSPEVSAEKIPVNIKNSQEETSGVAPKVRVKKTVQSSTQLTNQPARQFGFPNEQMLKELRLRLLETDSCSSNCAQIETMHLALSEQQLKIDLKIHSTSNIAVPLPSNSEQWRPDLVLVDNVPSKTLTRDKEGVLWVGLSKGIHHVVMKGRLPRQAQLQLSLPLQPKYLEWKGEGWTVEGIRDNHIPSQQIQLIRQQKSGSGKGMLEGGLKGVSAENNILPPLLSVNRTLHLGLDWTVVTQVSRLSPLGTPVSMKIPLLSNESVLSNAYPVKNGQVLINMSSMQRSVSWESKLPVADGLVLEATQTRGLVESWKLDISPIWHVEITGIPEIHHENQVDEWLPEWQPWPGEKVTLAVSRPQGISGKTLTIDRSILKINVGKRIRESELTLNLRSSRGGQHVITLPDTAELLSVGINGKLQPVRQNKRSVSLPIVPGEQRIIVKWRVDIPIAHKLTVLPVDIGVDNVNNSIHVKMGRDRWILFTNGPTMGPAVLFWGVLLVILIGSIILGKISHSPLKIWQWFLLGIGLSLATPIMIIIVAGWLLALKYRPQLAEVESRWVFNAGQVVLVLLTLIALGSLTVALQQGLLGWPDMQIAGNASYAWDLKWYQDRSAAQLPQPWVISVPLLAYRILMLLWALWLAFSLINWLRFGWQNFTIGGLWRKGEEKVREKKDEVA